MKCLSYLFRTTSGHGPDEELVRTHLIPLILAPHTFDHDGFDLHDPDSWSKLQNQWAASAKDHETRQTPQVDDVCDIHRRLSGWVDRLSRLPHRSLAEQGEFAWRTLLRAVGVNDSEVSNRLEQAHQSFVQELTHMSQPRRFRVALSFPGEARSSVVEPIAKILAERLGREAVFYDRHFEAELARPNLDTYLQHIYHRDSHLLVVFLGADYQRKDWCGLEWRAIRDLIKSRKSEQILLMRLDDGPVDGTFSIDGYINVAGRQPEELAGLIMQRLESL